MYRIHGSAFSTRAPEIFFIGAGLLLSLSGCCNTITQWDASGDWTGTLKLEDGVPRQTSLIVSRAEGITDDHEIRACDLRKLSWLVSGGGGDVGTVAAIKSDLSMPLCRIGTTAIDGGQAVLWGHPGGDTLVVTGIPSSEWTVTGHLHVTEYIDHNPPDPEVGHMAVSETVKGTVSLEARHPDGRRVAIEDATFKFEIVIRKDPYNPFD